MFWRTKKLTYRRGIVGEMLGALWARPAAALTAVPVVGLFVNNPVLNPDTSEDVFVSNEAAFTGYAQVAITTPPVVRVGGFDVGSVLNAVFEATDVVDPSVQVFGYFVATTDLGTWYAAELFAGPLTFANPGDFLSIDLIFPLPQIFTPTVV